MGFISTSCSPHPSLSCCSEGIGGGGEEGQGQGWVMILSDVVWYQDLLGWQVHHCWLIVKHFGGFSESMTFLLASSICVMLWVPRALEFLLHIYLHGLCGPHSLFPRAAYGTVYVPIGPRDDKEVTVQNGWDRKISAFPLARGHLCGMELGWENKMGPAESQGPRARVGILYLKLDF